MREPIYLRISSNKVIDISEYNEIEWGTQYGQYKVCCKSREDRVWRHFTFENADYAIRFANYFHGNVGYSDEVINSVEKAIVC